MIDDRPYNSDSTINPFVNPETTETEIIQPAEKKDEVVPAEIRIHNELKVNETAIRELKHQYDMFRRLQESVLQEGVDYGYPAGRRDRLQKPSLYKSGAEKLTRLFNLIPRFDITDVAKRKDYVMYEFKCSLYTQEGQLIGEGFGSCNSEEKDAWRKNALKFQNNIMKIAKKRAHVDATLTGLGASNVFTQDIEDMDEEQLNEVTTVKPQKVQQTTQVPATDKQLNYIHVLLNKISSAYQIDKAAVIAQVMELTNGKQFSDMNSAEKSSVITFLKMLNNKGWNPATKQIITMKKNILEIVPQLVQRLGRNFEDDIANLPMVIDFLSQVEVPDEAIYETDYEDYQEPPF